MALLTTVLSRIRKIFFVLFSVLKKPFCCRKRSRRNSGMILPMTVDKDKQTVHHFNPYPQLNNGFNANQHNHQFVNNSVNSVLNSNKSNFQTNDSNISNRVDNQSAEELEAETDFFKDMVPEFRRPKKVLLASNQPIDTQKSNRFGVDIKGTIFQSKELGVIDHFEDGTSSWEDNAANEEMWDTDQTLKDLRQQEREKRIAEHQRIKWERERRAKQSKNNLLATKIS